MKTLDKAALDVLIDVGELLHPEGNWCQGEMAIGPDGHKREPTDCEACQWCLLGAVHHCIMARYGPWPGPDAEAIDKRAVDALIVSLPDGMVWASDYNDAETTSHADVLALVRRGQAVLRGATA